MAEVAVIPNQNVVQRVTSLPLVSSTYGMMSDAYASTKGTHPYIKCVCEAAEHGVQTITSVALTSAQPIINTLEPQIAIANVLACYGLDKIEKTLPILQKQSDQIVADAVHAVSGAKDAVTVKVTGAKDTVSDTLNHMVVRTQGAVTGAKDTVSDTLTGMVVRTQGAVHGGVEITVAMVNTVLDSRVAHMVSSGVDTALSKSEGLVEQYLPLTEEELALEVKTVRGFDRKEPSYYVRLGSLSTKLRKRAYTRALAKVLDAKQRSQESIAQLNNTVDLIEYAKKNMNGAYSLVDWTSGGVKQEKASNGTEVIESRTLVLAHSLTQQLQTTCLVLVSGLQGLPHHIQQEALSISSSAAQVYASFRKAMAFGDLPDSMLANSKVQLVKMKESLDNVMDYLINNTPLNWLVGPFYPRMDLPAAAANTPPAVSSPSSSNSQYPMEVEMDSLASLDSLAAAANTPPATSSPSSSNSQLEEEGNAPVSPCRPAVSSSSNGQIPMEVEMDMQQSSC